MAGLYLSRKTVESGKVDPSRLANPTTSLVTRTILRHMTWKPFDRKLERAIFDIGSEVREKLSPFGAENCVIRAIRTTGATMLVESGNSETCRKITTKEVVERLSHVDGTMLNRIYARIRPPEMGTENVDEYLDLPDLNIGGVLINAGEAAFDVWLVAHMIGVYRGRVEEERLREALLKEVRPWKTVSTKKVVDV